MKNAISPLMSQPTMSQPTMEAASNTKQASVSTSDKDAMDFKHALNESHKEISKTPEVKNDAQASTHVTHAQPISKPHGQQSRESAIEGVEINAAAELSTHESSIEEGFVISEENLTTINTMIEQLRKLLEEKTLLNEAGSGAQGEIVTEKLESLLASLEHILEQQGGNNLPPATGILTVTGQLFDLRQDLQQLQAHLSSTAGAQAINQDKLQGLLNHLGEWASLLEKEFKQALSTNVKMDDANLLANERVNIKPAISALDANSKTAVQEGDELIKLNVNSNTQSLTNKQDVQFDALMVEKVGDKLTTAVKELQDIHSHLVRQTADMNQSQINQSINNPLKAQLSLSTPFQHAEWGQGVAERVMWMSSRGINEAEIYLDPPELGPLQVKVSLSNEQAHVSFVVQHSSVREALDQHAMRLREMFAGEGIDLVDVDVSDQSLAQEENAEGSSGQAGQNESHEEESHVIATTPLMQGAGLVNTYA